MLRKFAFISKEIKPIERLGKTAETVMALEENRGGDSQNARVIALG